MLTGNYNKLDARDSSPTRTSWVREGQSAREERLLLQEGWMGRGQEGCRGRTCLSFAICPTILTATTLNSMSSPKSSMLPHAPPLPPSSSSKAILSFPSQPSPPAAPSPGQVASAFCVPMTFSASRDQGLLGWKLIEPRDWIYPSVYPKPNTEQECRE